eukprot:gb/GECH01013036.1/.p1 GENE.gb/GECH01013036.1/~~gb/GECH01013036.1/.p1  ORF type:complete len:117 (+),score=27.23 gb/GECH01013036.1/:1-351(+)
MLQGSAMEKKGWMWKRGNKFKSWKKRWVVVSSETHCITYYNDESESEKKGEIELSVGDQILAVPEHANVKPPKGHDTQHMFLLVTLQPDRTWPFLCDPPSDKEKKEWMAAFEAAIP